MPISILNLSPGTPRLDMTEVWDSTTDEVLRRDFSFDC